MRQNYKKIIDSAKNIYGKRREGAPPLADMGCFVLSSVFPVCQKRIWKRAWKPLKSVHSGAPLKVCV